MDDVLQYFPDLSARQRNQLMALGPLYQEWNAKINVISRKDIDNLYVNHVLHSMSIAKFVSFAPNSTVLDAGTGGGFPGLPLAILFPDCNFVLIDSIAKKISVVNAVADAIGLTNVMTHHLRVEELNDTFDFVVSRAVTRLDTMWGWVSQKLSTKSNSNIPNGLLYLKGGDISVEKPNNCSVQYTPLTSLIDHPAFVQKGLVYIHKN